MSKSISFRLVIIMALIGIFAYQCYKAETKAASPLDVIGVVQTAIEAGKVIQNHMESSRAEVEKTGGTEGSNNGATNQQQRPAREAPKAEMPEIPDVERSTVEDWLFDLLILTI